jgi:hypothetical protein
MKKIINMIIENCSDCPFAVRWQDMGASGERCSKLPIEQGIFNSMFHKSIEGFYQGTLGILLDCPLPDSKE